MRPSPSTRTTAALAAAAAATDNTDTSVVFYRPLPSILSINTSRREDIALPRTDNFGVIYVSTKRGDGMSMTAVILYSAILGWVSIALSKTLL